MWRETSTKRTSPSGRESSTSTLGTSPLWGETSTPTPTERTSPFCRPTSAFTFGMRATYSPDCFSFSSLYASTMGLSNDFSSLFCRYTSLDLLLRVSSSFCSSTFPPEREDSRAGFQNPVIVFALRCFMPKSPIFQSCLNVFLSSWAEPVLSRGQSVLLKDTTQRLW